MQGSHKPTIGLCHKMRAWRRSLCPARSTPHTSCATRSAAFQRPVSCGGCHPDRFTGGSMASGGGVPSVCTAQVFCCISLTQDSSLTRGCARLLYAPAQLQLTEAFTEPQARVMNFFRVSLGRPHIAKGR